ncbi:MAG: anthranilate phosphoribosyltransferase, partial [Bacteroidota bacterium]
MNALPSTFHTALRAVADGRTLTEPQADAAMEAMLTGATSEVEIAGLLLGLRSRGETLDELAGFTRA